MRHALLGLLVAFTGCQEGKLKMIDDDNFLGSEDEIQEAAGDELDLAETVARMNPTSDQLQHFANLRGTKHALLDRQAPFARVNPPSVLKGTLGNQVVLEMTNANSDVIVNYPLQFTRMHPLQVANWVGEDAETTPITVTLAPVQNIVTDILSGAVNPYGIVQFGTRGSLAQLEVDVATGVQFTVNASMITLQLAMDATRALAVGEVLARRTLVGMISFGTTTHNLSLTRTCFVYLEPVGLVSELIVAVPPFARDVIFLQQTISAGYSYRLDFLDSSGTVVYQSTIAAGTQQAAPMILSGDVTSVKVVRTDAVFFASEGRFIFGLGL